jgi:acetyltransferase-like isoleucine patch superfamily enzyme
VEAALMPRMLLGVDTRPRRLWWTLQRSYRQLRQPRLHLGKNVQISSRAVLSIGGAEGERIVIGDACEIHRGAILATYRGWIEIGARSSVNPYSMLYGHGGLQIGSDVRIAAHCVIVPANHRFADPDRPIRAQGIEAQGIAIGDDVWIGAHVTVLDGSTIGRGSVIAAGSVVSGDIPEYSIAAGAPARVLRSRRGAAQPQGGGAVAAPHQA